MKKPVVSRKRHLLKAITWRIIASLTTFILGWMLTGEIEGGLAIGGADFVIKFVLYYLHERAWYKIDFGVDRSEKGED